MQGENGPAHILLSAPVTGYRAVPAIQVPCPPLGAEKWQSRRPGAALAEAGADLAGSVLPEPGAAAPPCSAKFTV